jgi:hypothetical protein
MEEKLDLLLLDNSNNLIEERNIPKPKTYSELKIIIKNNFTKLPEYYQIFYRDEYNFKKIINNEDEYKFSKDILFINELENKDNIKESMYELNYDKLSESKQDILDEKYNCFLCLTAIKNEKPYFCYICQKIFHHECLENWDKVRRLHHKLLNCPNCRNELPLDQWKQKLDFEEDRKKVADVLNKINKYKLSSDLNNNINMINEKRIKSK